VRLFSQLFGLRVGALGRAAGTGGSSARPSITQGHRSRRCLRPDRRVRPSGDPDGVVGLGWRLDLDDLRGLFQPWWCVGEGGPWCLGQAEARLRCPEAIRPLSAESP